MTYISPFRVAEVWLVRGRSMGATVTHLPSRVMNFQVSVVDQVLVFEPREPPVRQTIYRSTLSRI